MRFSRGSMILAFLLAAVAQPVSSDLFVWTPAEIDTLLDLGPEGNPRLYLLSQFMGYGYYTHLALVDHSGAGIPDSFCVNGQALVSPAEYSDTLPSCDHLQPLYEGAMPVLDNVRSCLPDTLLLLIVFQPFRSEPDTSTGRWVLMEGKYRALD